MAYSCAGIIFSSLNNNTLSRLTRDRTVSAIPFGCRYRLIDFALSNLVNANISNINIVSNYNYRSLLEHIGSGKDWDLARRSGGINIISPYQTAIKSNPSMFSTRMEALVNMKEYIDEFCEAYVVLMDSDTVLNFDLKDVLDHHISSGAKVTMVTTVKNTDYTSKNARIMVKACEGKICDIAMSSVYTALCPEVSLNIYVMSIDYLKKLIQDAIAHKINSLTTMLMENYKREEYRTYCYGGYVATVSSFLDYYTYSYDLATNKAARNSLLNNKSAPIYTRVRNSAPVIYKSGARVQSSMIADECVIEGTVINSILFRNVHISKGAVVKNSILFDGTYIMPRASVDCIVTDKNVLVRQGVCLSGSINMPFYVEKGRRV